MRNQLHAIAVACSLAIAASARAEVQTMPTTLVFGDVPVGTPSVPQMLVVGNSGPGPITIQFIATPPAVSVTGQPFPIGLLPGAMTTFVVTFLPPAPIPAGGSLTIETSRGPTAVTIAGAGVSMAVMLDRTNIDFGVVEIGEASASQPARLTNVTDVPIMIEGVDARAFSFVVDPPPPSMIPPRGTAMFGVRFVPSDSGPVSGPIDIRMRSGPPITLAVRGEGFRSEGGCSAPAAPSYALVFVVIAAGLFRRRASGRCPRRIA